MSDRRLVSVDGHPGIAKRQNGDGSWSYIVRTPARKGRPSTFSTLKPALAEQGLRRGGARTASMEPFADYAPRWIERFEGRNSSGLDEDTRAIYEDVIVRLAVPFFKRTPLARIDKPMVKRFIAHLRDDHRLSTASIQKYMTPLKGMFAELVEDGKLGESPTKVRIKGGPSSRSPRPKAIAPARVPRIAAELSEPMRELFMLLAFTALRISEACGLQWQDFGRDDDGHPTLQIRRQVRPPKPGRSRYKHHAKTAAGRRTVRLVEPIAQMLIERRARLNPMPGDPIFATSTGTPYSTHNVRRALRKASAAAGIEHPVTPHMLRHTVASLVHLRGWTDVQIQHLLGHKDPNFTKGAYLQMIEGGNMDVLDDAYKLDENSETG